MGWNGDVFSNSSLPFIFHLREPCCINQLHTRQQQRSTRLTRTRMCVIHLALPESNFPFLKNRLWIFLISNFRAIHFLRQVDRENFPPPPPFEENIITKWARNDWILTLRQHDPEWGSHPHWTRRRCFLLLMQRRKKMIFDRWNLVEQNENTKCQIVAPRTDV
jgi:hypothetical protein